MRKSSRAVGARRGRLSAPWLRFHGVDRPDVYIIIRVRATCCGESALNSPTAQPIPRRRPPLAPAQRRALPGHFLTPFPRTSAPPPRADARPPTSRPIPHRRPSLVPAQRHALPEHFLTPFPHTSTPPRSVDAHPPTSQPIPRHPPLPTPTQRHARPLRSASGTKKRHRTVHVRCRMFRSTVVRSVIWVGEPRAVRRRCGALACRRGA